MKKACILFLMLVCIIPVLAGCGEGHGFKAEKLPDGTIEITAYTGKEEDVIVPSELKGRKVTSIGDQAFKGCSSIDSITLPEGLLSIGAGAFQDCIELEFITIPDNVTQIGAGAFKNCKQLRSLPVSKGMTVIADELVYGAAWIRNIAIPEGITEIGNSAFENSGIYSVTLPSSVTSIGTGAFANCKELEEIKLNEGLVSIGENAFANLPLITEIYIPDSVTSISENAFGNMPADYNLYNTVFIVEKDSYAVQYLTDAGRPYGYYSAPNAETGISEYAYEILDDGTAKIMRYLGSDMEVAVPGKLNGYPVTIIGENAFHSNMDITSIELPEGITEISDSAFFFCTNLRKIVLPESLEKIESTAFTSCWDLTNITIPAAVNQIAGRAFWDCEDLISVTCCGMDTYIAIDAFDEVALNKLTMNVLRDSQPYIFAHNNSISHVFIDE